MIKEVIVVEGKDDESAVKAAVEAEVISVHGFGITKETYSLIKKAYETRGIIILTDPDFAGEKIRGKLLEKFPEAKHAYIPRKKAEKDGDIGIENANKGSIIEALDLAKAQNIRAEKVFCEEDLFYYGLTGEPDSKDLRDKVGHKLGIGYGNGKAFLNRLNAYNITKEELERAVNQCCNEE